MAEYTQNLENELYASWESVDQAEDDYRALLDYLNSPNFRSFGEGLETIIKMKMPLDSTETPISYLKRQYDEKGIKVNRNTLTNWFDRGRRPKKGNDDRRRMFKLAFALELSPEETADLFHRVYLDRGFNKRNYQELIYYHCLQNHRTWQDAERLIEKVFFDDSMYCDQTVYTSVIGKETERLVSDDELIEYINSHQHNFKLNNVMAQRVAKQYLEQACQEAQKEAENEQLDSFSNKDRSSVNFMYEVVTGQGITGSKGTKTIFKNAELPQEIKSCFPQPAVFSEKVPTFEELRKMIVFLFSYWFWRNIEEKNVGNCFDEYTDELDNLLTECGFSKLYFGNPFDWMFLFCTNMDYPLDAFRGLLAEALEQAT